MRRNDFLIKAFRGNMKALIILFIHWHLSVFTQSFFLHRYCSHKQFRMNQFWETFFYLFTYMVQGASFLNPRSYAIMHLNHHKFSDTRNDPHSPIEEPHFFKMMKKTLFEYQSILNSDLKYWGPEINVLDNFAKKKSNIALWIFIYSAIYYLLDIPIPYYLLIPIHAFLGPIQGAIVNWCGHKYGYRNFSLKDNSHNLLAIDFLCGGELYQNNHHRFSSKMNFASKWFEFDSTYLVCKLLLKLSIIK